VENLFLQVGSILILLGGLYILVKPGVVAEKIKQYYKSYPIIYHGSDRQLNLRTGFVRVLGAVIIIVGIICLISRL
jgi:uncharacterized membrane protein HdeD (DUF308 family)